MRWRHVFHPDFVGVPYWWDDAPPIDHRSGELPDAVDVLVVGAGYAGLNAALELARGGREPCVIDAHALGRSADTSSGGMLSGSAVFVPFRRPGISPERSQAAEPDELDLLSRESAKTLGFVEEMLTRETIDCDYRPSGHFIGACSVNHLEALRARCKRLNERCNAGAHIVDREDQWEEIGSDFYRGGMVEERSGSLDPHRYQRGLLNACSRHGVTLCSNTELRSIAGDEGAWCVRTSGQMTRANDIVMATNGYSERTSGVSQAAVSKRLVPIASHMVATETIPAELARVLLPKGRTVSETSRLSYRSRLTPDGRRILFGGSARLTPVGHAVFAPILYHRLLQRFPQLRGIRLTHAWSESVMFTRDLIPHAGKIGGIYYCVGGNGGDLGMLSYLGHIVARELTSGPTKSAFWGRDLKLIPLPSYRGKPWFLPLLGGYLKARDWLDRPPPAQH